MYGRTGLRRRPCRSTRPRHFVPASGAARDVEHVPSSLHVRLERRAGDRCAVEHDGLRAEVEHRVDVVAGDRALDRVDILEAAVHYGDAVDRPAPDQLTLRIVIGDQRGDRGAEGHECLRERGPHHARRAGDQHRALGPRRDFRSCRVSWVPDAAETRS